MVRLSPLHYLTYDLTMPPKNAARYPKPDSIAANPDASSLLTSIVPSGIVQPGDKARKWYKYPSYVCAFAPVSAEKLRKRFQALLNAKYKDQTKSKCYSSEFIIIIQLYAKGSDSGRCQPRSSLATGDFLNAGSEEDCEIMLGTVHAEINQDFDSDDPLRSPLTIKPLFVMSRWRHPKSRDGRLAIFMVLPTGALNNDDGIRTELETTEQLSVTFAWPSVVFDA